MDPVEAQHPHRDPRTQQGLRRPRQRTVDSSPRLRGAVLEIGPGARQEIFIPTKPWKPQERGSVQAFRPPIVRNPQNPTRNNSPCIPSCPCGLRPPPPRPRRAPSFFTPQQPALAGPATAPTGLKPALPSPGLNCSASAETRILVSTASPRGPTRTLAGWS